MLAVRMLVAKLEWLEGLHYWRGGRVAWVAPDVELAPGPSELSRAQRSLNKLRQYPIAGPQALGDADGWIAERQSRLELAKWLATLSAPDLDAVVDSARAGSRAALETLVNLVAAEGLCVDGLPASPAAGLLACRERAEPLVRERVEDRSFPLPGRALAALTLGALHRKLELRAPNAPDLGAEWLERAYRWGRQSGLPEEPALVTRLLEAPEGMPWAHGVLAAIDPQQPFRLEPLQLREWLARGVPARIVMELAEAVRDAAPVADRYLDFRHLLPEEPPQARREAAVIMQRQRQGWVATFRELLLAYASEADPSTVRLVTLFALQMLSLAPHTAPLVTSIHEALCAGLELPVSLHRAWLELMVQEHDRLWPGEPAQQGKTLVKQVESLKNWLDTRWSRYGIPVRRLLEATGDPEFVRETVQQDLCRAFLHLELPTAEYYHYILAIAGELDLRQIDSFSWMLHRALREFPTVAAARSALQPLIRAVAAAPRAQRAQLLNELLYELPDSRKGHREMPARLARYVPALLRFSPVDEEWEVCSGAIYAVGALDEGMPKHGVRWHAVLLEAVQQWTRAKPALAEYLDELGNCVRLGLALADGDWELFLIVVQAALNHPPRQPRASLQSGIEALPRFPALRAALAQVFPRQPHRCVDLVVRLGLVTRLGTEILSPLRSLEAPESAPKAGPPWDEVLHLDPDLEPLVQWYLRSQEVLGRSSALPAGVARALELPRKLAGELAHLERRAAEGAATDGMRVRIDNLRARLDDEAGLQTVMREEVRERLTEITSEARIAAAEQQVLACYRARLEQMAGPLPEDLVLTEDWLNAALLSARITENRHLLKRLLRTCATGDRRWREQHPENVRFLQSLADRGVDTEAWQRAHPRRYRCPELPGGVVRLRFEQDPLHILQMGNYFDTCLSFDGCNNYSTVANACELNKRVLYARDASGRVIARKLIGINAEGRLIGYSTYSTLSGESGEAVRRLVRHYVGEFAQRCGLGLANEGTVPRLFAERWYDDGLREWNSDGEPVVPKRKQSLPLGAVPEPAGVIG